MGSNGTLLDGETMTILSYAITVNFKSKLNSQQWKLSTVYDPSYGENRSVFIWWLYDWQSRAEEDWMLIGCWKNRLCMIVGCIALCLSTSIYRVQVF
jgi:hypothetical protein